MTLPTIEEQACGLVGPVLAECIKQRTAAGISKYGQRLDDNHQPDRAKAVHLVQELLDATQYALWLEWDDMAGHTAALASNVTAYFELTASEIVRGGKS